MVAVQANKKVDDLVAQMEAYKISDSSLNATIDNIKRQYDSRKAEMARINDSRKAQLQTLGMRTGGTRYAGATFGGVVAEEERQGLARVAELDAAMNDAILKAQEAQRTNNWSIFSKQVDLAESRRKELADTIAETNKAAIEQNKKIKERADQSERETAISSLYGAGITSPADILKNLNALGYDITSKDLKDTLDTLIPKGLDDLVKTARANGAPPEVLGAIASASDLNSAYNTAGKYGAGGAGIVGEYNFAKANGYTGSFAEYQNEDANRKRSIVNLNAGGLTPQENSTYLTITNKYQADSIINAAIKADQIRQVTQKIIDDPENTSNQLASLYLLVKNLDPDSAVREGELALAERTQSYLQLFNNSLTRLSKGQVLAPDAAKALAQATQTLVGTWEETAKKKEKLYISQAKNSSPNVGSAFNQYLNDFKESPSTEQLAAEEKASAEANISSYNIKHPEKAEAVDALFDETNPETGLPLSQTEIWQIIETWE